jgi:hypothetical protein
VSDKQNGRTSSIVAAIATVLAAGITAWGVASSQTSGKVEDSRFERVAQSNCEAGNELRATLREVILSAPENEDDPRASDAFVDRALALLQPRDCEALVGT